MNHLAKPRASRRATNVSLPEDLVRAARDLGVSVSKACEQGLRAAVAEARREAWIRENRPAMDAWNAYVAEHGIPYAEFRQF